MNNPYENTIPNDSTKNNEKELSPEEKQEKIEKKIEAIRKQSPNMSPDEIVSISAKEVDNFVEVWGAINTLGGHWYRVEGESKEKMTEWKSQVENIISAFDDEERFYELTGIHSKDIKNIKENISKEGELDNKAKTLLSINLWLKREQGGRWAGHRKTIWRVLAKESTSLTEILDRDGAPACIDTSFLTKALAEEFDIKGDVKKVPISKSKLAPEKMAHFYFQAKTDDEEKNSSKESSGIIADYWWARSMDESKDTGGIKLTQDSYDKVVDERTDKNICGY